MIVPIARGCQAFITPAMLRDSTGALIGFPKTITANTSLLTDVIDGRGYFGINLMYKDDSAAARLKVYWRAVALEDGATDLIDADAASNSASNTGETVLDDTSARNKWKHDVTMDTVNYGTVGLLGLGLFRLRFAPKTNGQATVIKSVDAFYLNSR